MLKSHNRFPYSAIVNRPDFTWPGERRLAVYIALCVEHFAYDDLLLAASYSPGTPHPNTYNWAWREYGNRVGGWRLLELFEEFGLPVTVLLNTACYDHCPELPAAFSARGDEIVAHGRTNSEHQNGMTAEAERKLIGEVTHAIETHAKTKPGGWMSPGANPSRITEDLLAEAGYRYTLDWPHDDQPTWMKTANGPLLALPYPHEINDVPVFMFHDGTAKGFCDAAIDNFDEVFAQSRKQSLVYGITIHTFLMGQPFRLKQFRRVLEHLAKHRAELWFTTAGKIASHYETLFPPPPA